MKKRLATYIRVSSKAQKDEDTKQRQIENFENAWRDLLSRDYDLFAKINGAKECDRYFTDEAFNLETWNEDTDFVRLMHHCEVGDVQTIFVSEPDRLFRSRSNQLRGRILDIIQTHKIEVVTKAGKMSDNSILMELMASMSAEDKRGILRKCHDGKITRLSKEGRPPTGKSPFCFQWDKEAKTWHLVPKEVEFFRSAVSLSLGKVIHPEVPDKVKAIVEMNSKGMNDKTVAQTLSGLGFSKRSFHERIKLNKKNCVGTLTSGAIEVMFREDRYRGLLEFKMVGTEFVGNLQRKTDEQRKSFHVQVPQILTDEIWEELQEKRTSRRKWAKYNQVHDYLCKDLLICKTCGIALAARPKYTNRVLRSGKRVSYEPILYYVCARKQKHDGFRCPENKCHAVVAVDNLVWNSFVSVISNPKNLKAVLKKCSVDGTSEKRREKIEGAIASVERIVETYQGKINETHTMWVENEIAKDAYTRTLKLCEDKIVDAEVQIRTLRAELRNIRPEATTNELLDLLKSVDFTRQLSFEQRRDALKCVVSKIEITASGEITILLKGGAEWLL